MYPERNPDYMYTGVFVKEQMEALEKTNKVDCDLYVIDGFKSKFVYFWTAISLFLKISFGRYDIVHVHYGLSGLFMLLNPFKKTWKNVVLTLHGGDILADQGKPVQVWLTKQIVKRAAKVITLNDRMNAVVSKLRSDYDTIPCGVDSLFLEKYNPKTRKNIVLFPGGKDREVKNFPFFSQVVNEYNRKYEYLEPLPLHNFSREEVRELMHSSTAMLMTSISEGSPQAIKEALSCDLPIVSSDVGDVSKVFGDTKGTSIYLHSETAEEVADRLHLTIHEAQSSLGVRRERIYDLQLANEQIANKLLDIYNELAYQ